MAAVRVPPSACSTSQSTAIVFSPNAARLMHARSDRPMRRLISWVRPDGRPHVTPLPAVWADGALHFCTGPEERKAHNLAANPHVTLTTGNNTWDKGYDLVVEGEAVRVTHEGRLRELAAAWEAKYGSFWHFEVREGAFHHGGGQAFVFSVAPRTVFGFGKGEPFSQTRWRFT